MYDREIDVNNNSVSYLPGRAYDVDCSALKSSGIVMICQKGEEIWAEREPYNGRETDFDVELVESLFRQAESIGAEFDRLEKENIDLSQRVVPRYCMSKAIFEKDYVLKYQEWFNSPDRSFLEKESLKYQDHWERDSEIYKSLIQGLGLSEEEENKLFMLAKSY